MLKRFTACIENDLKGKGDVEIGRGGDWAFFFLAQIGFERLELDCEGVILVAEQGFLSWVSTCENTGRE